MNVHGYQCKFVCIRVIRGFFFVSAFGKERLSETAPLPKIADVVFFSYIFVGMALHQDYESV